MQVIGEVFPESQPEIGGVGEHDRHQQDAGGHDGTGDPL
jgi:hypothetical protein